MCRNDCSVARQSQTDSLVEAVHRVGCKHTRARATSGAGASLNLGCILVGAVLVGAEHHCIDKVGTTTTEVTRLHRTTRHEYGGDVKAHRCHQHTRGNLIAVADAYQGVHLVSIGHILHRVDDNVARGERVEHTVVTHSDTVVDGYGVELGCEATLLLDEFLYILTYLVKVHVTGYHLSE